MASKGMRFAASFAIGLLTWTALWVAVCSFSVSGLSWPGTWDAAARLIFIVSGLLVCTTVASEKAGITP